MPELPDDLTDAVRRAYVRPVDDAVAGRHVAAMVAASLETTTSPVAVSSRRRGRLLQASAVAAAGLAVLALPAGLAVAGVALPDVAKAPYDVVGVELPNQASDTARDRVPILPVPAPARTTATTPSAATPPAATPPATRGPSIPDGGVPQGHDADDVDRRRGERRSETRNNGRRGAQKRSQSSPQGAPPPPAQPPPQRPKKPKAEKAPQTPKPQKAPKPSKQRRSKTPPAAKVPEPVKPPKAEKALGPPK